MKKEGINLSGIYGNEFEKEAVEIAVAGRHPMIIIGDAGSGKTTLAEAAAYLYRLTGWDHAGIYEGIETDKALQRKFLQAVKEGRSGVGTMRSCPCGQLLEPYGKCGCSDAGLRKYWKRVSADLLMRVPVYIRAGNRGIPESRGVKREDSITVSHRVLKAHELIRDRYGISIQKVYASALELPVTKSAFKFAEEKGREAKLSTVSFMDILRVGFTAALLETAELSGKGVPDPLIKERHIAKAFSLRKAKMYFLWG